MKKYLQINQVYNMYDALKIVKNKIKTHSKWTKVKQHTYM